MMEHDPPLREWKNLLSAHAGAGLPVEASPLAAPQAEAEMAELARLVSLPQVQSGSVGRGAVVCLAGEECLTAVLLWRGMLFGIYRHRIAARALAEHCRDLAEFRLGWLPEESVIAAGGIGSAFAPLPAEAEGFPLAHFAGANAALFAGYGRIYPPLA